MKTTTELPFLTLMLIISFASVNAVLFTPGLPNIAHFFSITDNVAQHTISWFLVGYAIGQLFYGPLANRYGRKPALYMGIWLEIVSSLFCVLAGMLHAFPLLLVGRFFLALGSGVGLNIVFTLVNEFYKPEEAAPKISYLMLSFAITPGLSIALGGILNTYFGWMSCFFAGAIYGVIMLFLVMRLPETKTEVDKNALQLTILFSKYKDQFKNSRLVIGGLLMGFSGAFIYIFAAVAPFMAMTLLGMSSASYGFANILPPLGIGIGSFLSSQLANRYSQIQLIKSGIFISVLGILWMLVALMWHLSVMLSLFLPAALVYCGACFVLANASMMAMSDVSDKAQASAVMSFLNMSISTLSVLTLSLFSITKFLLPISYLLDCLLMMVMLLSWQVNKSFARNKVFH